MCVSFVEKSLSEKKKDQCCRRRQTFDIYWKVSDKSVWGK